MRFSPKEPRFYVLQGKLVVPARDMDDWAKRFDEKSKHVASSQVGGIWISTVFLGIDHNWSSKEDELPMVFETSVFKGGASSEIFGRCASWDEAEKIHKACVAAVRAELKEKIND